MRRINLDYLFDRRRFTLGLFNPAVLICLGILVLAGYLISVEGYIFLGVMTFGVLGLASCYANVEILLIYLLIISIPFRNFELFSLNNLIGGWGDVPIHSSHVLAAVLIATVSIRVMPKIGKIDVSPIGKMILLLVSIYSISIIGVFQAHQNFTEYLKSMANLLLFAMLYFAFTNSIRRHETVIKICKFWVLVSLLIALYGFYQLFSYFMPSLPVIAGTEIIVYGGIPRVSSMLKEPVPFIQFLVYPTIFMTVLVSGRQMFPFRALKVNVVILVALVTALILSFSLTAGIYLLIFLLLFMLSHMISARSFVRKLELGILITGVFLVAVVFMGIGEVFLARFGAVMDLSDPSTRWRIQTLSIGWQEFLKYPLLGIGAGNFPSYTATGIFPEAVFNYEVQHSDTLFFQILAELGIAGVIGMGLLFGSIFIGLRKVISLNKTRDLNFHISRGLYFVILTYIFSTLIVSGWLEFWVWFNISIIGTWVLHESKRLMGIQNA